MKTGKTCPRCHEGYQLMKSDTYLTGMPHWAACEECNDDAALPIPELLPVEQYRIVMGKDFRWTSARDGVTRTLDQITDEHLANIIEHLDGRITSPDNGIFELEHLAYVKGVLEWESKRRKAAQ